VKLSPLNEL